MRSSNVVRFALMAAMLVPLASAQRGGYGGGMRGGAGRVGTGPQGAAGQRDFWGGRPAPIRTDLPPPTGLNPPAAGYTGIAPGGLQTIGPRSRGGFLPFIGAPIYYPGAFGYANSSVQPYNSADANTATNSNMMAAQEAMVEQIRQLSADLQQMKASNATPAPAPPAPASAPASVAASPVPDPEPASVPIRIVLRNGEQFTSKSYAIMNGTLWDFSSSRVRKIPVSSVDVAASTKATEAHGGEFPNLRTN